MATQELMAVLLRAGDTIMWLPPEADDLTPIETTITHVHNADPVVGKIRFETDRTKDIRVSARTILNLVVQLKR